MEEGRPWKAAPVVAARDGRTRGAVMSFSS